MYAAFIDCGNSDTQVAIGFAGNSNVLRSRSQDGWTIVLDSTSTLDTGAALSEGNEWRCAADPVILSLVEVYARFIRLVIQAMSFKCAPYGVHQEVDLPPLPT